MNILVYGVGEEARKYEAKAAGQHTFFKTAKALGKNVADCDMIIVTERQGWDFFDTLVNGLEDYEDLCIKHDVDVRPIVLLVSESLDKNLDILKNVYDGYTFYSSKEVAEFGETLRLNELEFDVSFLKI